MALQLRYLFSLSTTRLPQPVIRRLPQPVMRRLPQPVISRTTSCFISSTSLRHRFRSISAASSPSSSSSAPLDLTEENVQQVLVDARTKFGQIFDTSVGMTGVVDLAELDGPYVKLRLKGRFWHTRQMVLARLTNYLKIRIPEILEVDIEDQNQLDDSPDNF